MITIAIERVPAARTPALRECGAEQAAAVGIAARDIQSEIDTGGAIPASPVFVSGVPVGGSVA